MMIGPVLDLKHKINVESDKLKKKVQKEKEKQKKQREIEKRKMVLKKQHEREKLRKKKLRELLKEKRLKEKEKEKLKSKSKLKKSKDPNRPKRPSPPLFMWMSTITREPGVSITQHAAKCGEQWHELDPVEKTPYIEKYQRQMEEYKVSVLSWKNQQPKKPMNAYNHFIKNNYPKLRDESPDLHVNDIFKLLAKQWSNLTPDEKSQYRQNFLDKNKQEPTDEDEDSPDSGSEDQQKNPIFGSEAMQI